MSVLLPLGEGGAKAPDEGNPPHDFVDTENRGAGSPHPALTRHPLPGGEGTHEKPFSVFEDGGITHNS